MSDRLAMLFISLGIFTSLMIVKDLGRAPQPLRIMNLVWPVTGLYMPFVGWLAWWYFGRNNRPATPRLRQHRVESPDLKQLFFATSHGAAGCVLGDVLAVPLLPLLSHQPFHSVVVTHAILSLVLSLFFGIILQYLALKQIVGMAFFRTLWQAIKSDIFSLMVYQAGMFLYMTLAFHFILQNQLEPLTMNFWFMMQLALLTGFVFAWPANKFLLQRGIKISF